MAIVGCLLFLGYGLLGAMGSRRLVTEQRGNERENSVPSRGISWSLVLGVFLDVFILGNAAALVSFRGGEVSGEHSTSTTYRLHFFLFFLMAFRARLLSPIHAVRYFACLAVQDVGGTVHV